jgi:hypothetical protein
MNTGKMRIFQYEIARQCRFALIATEDLKHSLDELAKIQAQHSNILILPLEMSFRDDGEIQNLAIHSETPTVEALRYSPQVDRLWYSLQALFIAVANISKLLPVVC